MSNNPLNYEEIHQRAEKRVKKRAEFIMHLAIYLIVNLFVWAFFVFLFLTGAGLAVLIPAVLTTLASGLGLAIHGITVFVETTAMDNLRDREIQREIQREMLRRGLSEADLEEMYEKPKREQVARLSDDGEMIYDENQPASGRRKRSSRD